MKSMGQRARGARLERMQDSPRWVDGSFRNLAPIRPGLRDPAAPRPSLSDFLCGGPRRVPVAPLPALDPREGWRRPPDTGLRATWLGHSTVLLEFSAPGGQVLRVLTDPVWGERASPSRLAGPKRFQPVPVALAALPPIDLVLISHDHYDHLDYPTVRELARLDLPILTSLGVGAHLEHFGVRPERITELDWWQRWELRDAKRPGAELAVTATPSQHFSGRGLKDRNATLWSSFVIETPTRRAFFSGDTGLTDDYTQIRERCGAFDLVMLEVGAHHPSWGDIHLGPDNAIEALALLGGGPFLPVHWGTFALAVHDWDAPAESLYARAPGLASPLLMPRLGEVFEPAQAQAAAPQPWWRAIEQRAAPGSGKDAATGAADPAETTPEALPRGMVWPAD